MGAALLTASAFTAMAADEPIITFHTDLYDMYGAANVFTFYLGASENTYVDVDCGFGATETELEQAYYDTDKSKIQGTPITCTVSEEGLVKVYGDASKIDYIDMEGCYITSIEWPEMTEVEIMNLSHNLFKSLDISHMTKLQALYANDIPCTEATPFIVGASKPDLAILELAMVEWLDPAFNLTGYPAMRSFTAYSTPSLRNVDTSKCPLLLQLSVDATSVEHVDVSNNPALLILNVSDTKVSSVDVSKNPYLTELYVQHEGSVNTDCKLTSLDVSKNPELQRLYLAGNRISELDLSANKLLTSFSCRNNLIGALDFTGLSQLTLVDVSHNRMTFATCPEPAATYSEYYYAQDPMAVERSYKEGDVLDLSEALLRAGSATEAVVYVQSRENPSQQTILGDEYWTYDAGKITLLKACADSVYVAAKNTMFPDWVFTTTPFKVKTAAEFGLPTAVVKAGTSIMAKEQNLYVGVAGATPESPVSFTVDFGDGKPVTFTATTSRLLEVPNVTGKRGGTTTTIYMPEGADLTALKIADMRLNSLDVSAATSLLELEVTGCSLPSVDLRWNSRLTRLDLSGNQLSAVDLSEPDAAYLKNWLGDINLSDNRISTLKLVDNYGLRRLDVSKNRLTALPLQHATQLTYLDVSDNSLEEISVIDCELLEYLDVSGNLVSEIVLPDYLPLQSIDISRNRFTLATLPAPGFCDDYVYAPQAMISIPTKAPSINLSSQDVTVNGHRTVYSWFKASDNTPVTEGIRANGGRFIFEDPSIGEIYCTMTNGAFPQLSGADAFRTTAVATAEVPTNVFATFVTATNGESSMSLAGVTDGTTIYIDWTGNGDLEQYILKSSYTLFTAQTFADAQVKCYSYDENDGVSVFSISNTPMKTMDASSMKSVKMFGLSGANIPAGELKLPTAPTLDELSLNNNGFTEMSLEGLENIVSLSLNGNKLSSIDVSGLKKLETLYLSNNNLKSIVLDNPRLWELSATGNELEDIDFTGVPAMNQLWLSHNKFSHIDISAMKQLRVLTIDNNRFDLSTLPLPSNNFYLYSYANQASLPITVENGKVDLSSQAKVGEVNTVYAWYIDTPYFDESDALVGEELYENEEYTLENGVTTFIKPFNHIMCVMTNAVFPSLYLYTDFVDVVPAGVDNVSVADSGMAVTVAGDEITVRSSDADGTPVALIALDGRVLASGSICEGVAVLRTSVRGTAVVAAGNRAAKVIIR